MEFTRLDIRKIIARFGGRSELHRRLKARGCGLSVKTVEKWIERDNIPSHRLVQLIELAAHEKRPLDLIDYVLKAPNAKDLSPKHRYEKHQKDQGHL